MRGSVFQTEVNSPVDSQTVGEVAEKPELQTNLSENMKIASKHSVWFWAGLLGLYLFWDYIQTRRSIQESLEPANIRANLHNLVVIGIGAVVIINGMNVFLTKLASMKIPGVSKVAGNLLPLFHL